MMSIHKDFVIKYKCRLSLPFSLDKLDLNGYYKELNLGFDWRGLY
jgi:hypothetical protein